MTCHRGSSEDLFWASRGGGGGNFGDRHELRVQAAPATEITLFSLHWPWAAAADVMSAWQTWGPSAPDEVWSDCHLLGSASGSTASVNGAYVGTATALAPLLNQLKQAVGTAPSESSVNTMAYLDAALLEAGCSGWSVSQCRLPSQGPGGRLGREASLAKSDYFADPIPHSAIQTALGVIEQRSQDPSLGRPAAACCSTRGAASSTARPRTPPHSCTGRPSSSRSTSCRSSTVASPSTVSKNQAWLHHLYGALHPSATGFAYQNYIDPHLKDWQQAYYGANLTSLIDVKDPLRPRRRIPFRPERPGRMSTRGMRRLAVSVMTLALALTVVGVAPGHLVLRWNDGRRSRPRREIQRRGAHARSVIPAP